MPIRAGLCHKARQDQRDYQGWDQSKTVLAATVCAEVGGRKRLRPEIIDPIRAGLLTLKMTPTFIRAHGSGLRA